MHNRSWVRNPIRINFATVYNAFIEKPFSFFLMVVVPIAVYKFISIEALFVFEFFSIALSLVISFNEKNKIDELLLSDNENSLEEMAERIRISNNAFAMYSIIGWTSLVIGLLNLNYYLILSSLVCIYFIGVLTRRIDPYFNPTFL